MLAISKERKRKSDRRITFNRWWLLWQSKKEYLETFIEEQENQYMLWKYTTSGRPTPFEEGKGNKKKLAIMYYVAGAVAFLLGGLLPTLICTSTSIHTNYTVKPPTTTVTYYYDFDFATYAVLSGCFWAFAIVFFFAGRNHWKKHKQILEARKQRAQNAPRKKRKKKKR